MKWSAWAITSDCPVKQVVPEDGQDHREGIDCLCLPCLDSLGAQSLLVHHELVDGRPVICTEPDSHDCELARKA